MHQKEGDLCRYGVTGLSPQAFEASLINATAQVRGSSPVNFQEIPPASLHRQRAYRYALQECERALGRKLVSSECPASWVQVSLNSLKVDVASIRGHSHMLEARPNQDCVGVSRANDLIVAVVADGVSSVSNAELGARYLVESVLKDVPDLVRAFQGEGEALLSPGLLAELHQALYKTHLDFASEHKLSLEQTLDNFLCATLLIQITTSQETLVLAIGDGFLGIGDEYYATDEGYRQLSFVAPRKDPETEQVIAYQPLSRPPLFRHLLKLDNEGMTVEEAAASESTIAQLRSLMAMQALQCNVIAYGPTAQLTAQPLVLSTDGHMCTEDINKYQSIAVYHSGDSGAEALLEVRRGVAPYTCFPFERLFRQGYSTEQVESLALLYNIAAMKPEEISREMFFTALVAAEGMKLHAVTSYLEALKKLCVSQGCVVNPGTALSVASRSLELHPYLMKKFRDYTHTMLAYVLKVDRLKSFRPLEDDTSFVRTSRKG